MIELLESIPLIISCGNLYFNQFFLNYEGLIFYIKFVIIWIKIIGDNIQYERLLVKLPNSKINFPLFYLDYIGILKLSVINQLISLLKL